MCRPITCPACKRPSWAGCGAHVEQVLGHVPTAERCQCSQADRRAAKGTWLQRLRGKSSQTS